MDIGAFFAPKAVKPAPANNSNGNNDSNNSNVNNNNVNDGGQGNNQNSNANGNNNQNSGYANNNNANGNNGNNNQNSGNNSEAKGIDRFAKMWDTPTTEGDAAPTFKLDPKTLSEVADAQDFMQGIDPELMQKATSGDVQSLLAIIKKTSQNAYKSALEHGSTLTDKFVGARETHSSKSLGNRVKEEMTTSALAAIPNYKNPVVQKQLKQTAAQLQKLHPDATPGEIVQMSIEYFQELTAVINPDGQSGKTGTNKTPAKAETDWEKYFNLADEQ